MYYSFYIALIAVLVFLVVVIGAIVLMIAGMSVMYSILEVIWDRTRNRHEAQEESRRSSDGP